MSATTTRKPRQPQWSHRPETIIRHWQRTVGKHGWSWEFLKKLDWSARLRRLFAVACCRHPVVWRLMSSTASRDAVEVAERFADHLATWTELKTAREAAWTVWREKCDQWRNADAAAAAAAAAADAAAAAADAADAAAAADAADAADAAARRAQHDYHAQLVVSFIGPGWRFKMAWRTDTVLSLARSMYDSRDFSAAPILADALQEAGCPEGSPLLAQLRDPASAWARGSRVFEVILGKPS